MSTINLGTLTTPKSINDATVTTSDPTDISRFTITGTSSINLSLNEISAGDNANLFLYRDSNGNGRLDRSTDTLVSSSQKEFNQDDAINVQANTGTYFSLVERYAPGSSGDITYDLDLSATPLYPVPADSPTQAPNLLPNEFTVGHFGILLSSDQTFNGSVGNNNTADVYSFQVGSTSGRLNGIRLSGLSEDADIRLIQDSNRNHIVDQGEVIGFSTNASSTDDVILGNQLQLRNYVPYLLEVYQFSGNTNYQLTFDVA